MAVPEQIDLLIERKKATPEFMRVLTHMQHANILSVPCVPGYDIDLYNEFLKPEPEGLTINKLFTTEVTGPLWISFLKTIPQGAHLVMKRHLDPKRALFGFYNMTRLRQTISEDDTDVYNFRDPKDYEHYLNIIRDAQVKTITQNKQLFLMRCFVEDDTIKKFDSSQSNGLFCKLLENLDDDLSYLDRLTHEELTCLLNDPANKDKLPFPKGCTPGSSGHSFDLTTALGDFVKLKTIFEKIRKSINKTEVTAEKSNLIGSQQENDTKLAGMFEKVLKIINDIKHGPTDAYNIGYENGQETKAIEHGLGIYQLNSELKVDTANKDKTIIYQCDPKEDLILMVNHDDFLRYSQLVNALTLHPERLNPFSAESLGIKKVATLKWVKSGECYLIDKKTLNFFEYDVGSNFHYDPTNEITNRWFQFRFSVGVFPFICVKVKQAS